MKRNAHGVQYTNRIWPRNRILQIVLVYSTVCKEQKILPFQAGVWWNFSQQPLPVWWLLKFRLLRNLVAFWTLHTLLSLHKLLPQLQSHHKRKVRSQLTQHQDDLNSFQILVFSGDPHTLLLVSKYSHLTLHCTVFSCLKQNARSLLTPVYDTVVCSFIW